MFFGHFCPQSLGRWWTTWRAHTFQMGLVGWNHQGSLIHNVNIAARVRCCHFVPMAVPAPAVWEQRSWNPGKDGWRSPLTCIGLSYAPYKASHFLGGCAIYFSDGIYMHPTVKQAAFEDQQVMFASLLLIVTVDLFPQIVQFECFRVAGHFCVDPPLGCLRHLFIPDLHRTAQALKASTRVDWTRVEHGTNEHVA